MDGDRGQRVLCVCDELDMRLVNSLQSWRIARLNLLYPEEDDRAVFFIGRDRPSFVLIFGSFIGLEVRFTDSDVRQGHPNSSYSGFAQRRPKAHPSTAHRCGVDVSLVYDRQP